MNTFIFIQLLGSRQFLMRVGIVVAVMVVLLFLGKIPIRYSLRNLAVRWKTTVVTALAFTVVVFLLTFMLAFVNGMTRLTDSSGHPGNVIVLSDGATDESWSNLAPTDLGDVDRQPGILSDEAGQPLCSKEVYIIANQALPTTPGAPERRRFVQVRGVEDPRIAARIHGLELLEGGSWFSVAGVGELSGKEGTKGETAIQALLGEGVARELGRDVHKERLEVGDVFELGPRKWKVVGLLRSAGSAFGSEVWAKGSYVADLYGKLTVSSLVLKTADADSAKALAEDLNMNFKKANLQAQPETEYYSKLSATNQQFLGAIWFITYFMAFGGILAVMNTMFAAISQRTKDIGVLRILGFGRRQLLVVFVLESLIIGLLGGFVGCVLGSLTNGWTATSIVSGGQGGFGKTVVLRLVVDGNTVAAGLGLTLVMAIIGALLPALKAMRLRPLESLR